MKIIKWLDEHFEAYVLTFLMAFTVVLIFLQVVMRYVFSNSLTWTEEIARYAFIWMIYIGVSYGVKKRKHLGVDALSMLFQRKGQIILSSIANSIFLIFAVVITYFGLEIFSHVTRESAALRIPLHWVYMAPVAGFALTAIRLIQNMVREVKEINIRSKEKGNNFAKKSQEGIL